MDSDCDILEIVYSADDYEYRIYCDSCDKLCIERYNKNNLKSGSHNNNIHERQRSNKIKL